jgi:hypothetical protein
MCVVIRPTHDNLDDAMKNVQGSIGRNQQSPPDWSFCSNERYSELIKHESNRSGIL